MTARDEVNRAQAMLDIVVMAAGKGTRMRSARPKVLHRLAGRSLLQHVLGTAQALQADRIIVVTGHSAAEVEAELAPSGALAVRQEPQLGTGHAVQQAAPLLHEQGTTLILNGDVPLIEPASLRALLAASGGERLALLTVTLADAAGYGRIVRAGGAGRDAKARSLDTPAGHDASGAIRAIVEERDATPEQRAIREIYTGIMALPTRALKRWLAALRCDNAQGEYYLTDIVAMAVAEGVPVVSAQAASETEVLGINSALQLADLERRYQRAQAEALMEAGVRLADPARLDVRGQLLCGRDVEIDIGCIFEGRVEIGDEVVIGAHCVIRNATIAAGAVIRPFSHIDGEALGVQIGANARVGPYARLRAGAVLGDEVHIGNFVEVKNATLGRGAKANHLAYLGDAAVGEGVNFGAGSITANYDGVNKHHTTIGAGARVGSNCVLVAPVAVGANATIGGGSTITADAPADALTLARARQVTLPDWQRPKKA